MPVAKSTKCPVEAYAESVLKGKTVAGRLVRLACERHLRDLDTGHQRGLHFDHDAARRIIRFFGYLTLPEGDKPFELSPWQAFIEGSLFGWMGPDGFRRFRTAYVEGGKGCGKTPIAAGTGLYGLCADDEPSAEIYMAGVTRDQGTYLLRDATNLAQASTALRTRIKINTNNLSVPQTNSYMRAVSSEGRTLDQKRVHMAFIDEAHEHPTPVVIDKMRAGTKGRNQALIYIITNSGHDRTTVCYRLREYSEKVLQQILEDDSWFAYVCGLDACEACQAAGQTQPTDGCPDCDDWRDENTWIKANPNLGVSLPYKYLREQVREAIGMPTKANMVKRLNFCIWTETAEKCIPMDAWDQGTRAITASTLAKRQCFAALDIGATSDFTAFVLVFPHDDEQTVEIPIDPTNPAAGHAQQIRRSFSVLPFFWLPERPVARDASMEASIEVWKQQGFIRTTEGNTVDYDQVLADIQDICDQFAVSRIAIDRAFQGSQMATNLQKVYGDEMVVSFAQGILSMASPFREMLELLKAGRLHHDGNPVLRWMASNTAAETRGGLTKPSKDKSSEKIDGITALTMALGIAITAPPDDDDWYTPGILRN